jgi:serine/threonine protein phosphatase PrpC
VNWDDTIIEAAATDTGMRRANNQDRHIIVRAPNQESWRRRGHLFMVADGMGAHAVGELASKMACDNIPHTYNKLRVGTPAEALVKSYQEVGAEIHRKATANRDFQGMGTTCTTLVLLPDGAMIGHVGDSRVYRMRNDRIDQLSFDHSLVWEVVRLNRLTNEQAQQLVPKNVITRSLGPEPKVEVDIEGPIPVEHGDVFLLCSDGLSGPVADAEIGAFAGHFHPEDACKYLVHLANLRGGHDNITCLIVRSGEFVPPTRGGEASDTDGKAKRKEGAGGFKRLLGAFHKPHKPPAVEEHLYRSEPCPIEPKLVARLIEQVRRSQAQALEQSWPIDLPKLAVHRREADDSLAAGDFWTALKNVGEAIAMLGLAGRVHKKASAAAHAN